MNEITDITLMRFSAQEVGELLGIKKAAMHYWRRWGKKLSPDPQFETTLKERHTHKYIVSKRYCYKDLIRIFVYHCVRDYLKGKKRNLKRRSLTHLIGHPEPLWEMVDNLWDSYLGSGNIEFYVWISDFVLLILPEDPRYCFYMYPRDELRSVRIPIKYPFSPVRQKLIERFNAFKELNKEEELTKACAKCGREITVEYLRSIKFFADPSYRDILCPGCGTPLIVDYRREYLDEQITILQVVSPTA